MRDRHTREFIFLDLILSVDPEGFGGIQSLRWFCQHIFDFYEKNATSYWGRDKAKKTRISSMSDYKHDDKSITMLLHFNDRRGPDAAFCDMETDSQREEAKKKSEGRPETAHLLFKLDPEIEGGNRYLALLEVSSRLNRAYVERYLNWIFREIKKSSPEAFEYLHPDGAIIRGKPHTVKITPRVELQGHVSDEFSNEIASGRLSGIKLISRDKKHFSTGETALVRPSVNEIKLEPVSNWRQNPLQVLQDALGLGRNADYSTAKISFLSSDGASHTCELDTQTGNIYGDGFIKKKRMHRTDLVLKEAEENIHISIETEMKMWLDVPVEHTAVGDEDVDLPVAATS